MTNLIIALFVGIVIPGLLVLAIELRKLMMNYYDEHHHHHPA